MAPEQIQSQAFPASDQYALGVVVYQWLCGIRPFQGSFTEIAIKHALASPPLLRERIPGVSAEVEQVVMRALAKDPQQRFAGIKEFAVALEQASQRATADSTGIAATPVTSEESTLSIDTVPFSMQMAPPAASSLTPVLSSPQASALHLPSIETPLLPRETSALEQPSTTALSAGTRPRGISQRTALVGLAGIAAVSAVGGGAILLSHIQASQKPPASSPASNKRGAILYTYREHNRPVWCVAWSPDGDRLASAGQDKTAQVWDAADGSNAVIYTGHSNAVRSATWSRNGKRIASGSWDQTVRVWQVG